MRYHFEAPSIYLAMYGRTYHCDHPVYNECTLYEENGKGLAVIQQYCNPITKVVCWLAINPALQDSLYLHPKFKEFFEQRAGQATDGLYPTVTIRQIMWALKMKPMKRERWETYFDRKEV